MEKNNKHKALKARMMMSAKNLENTRKVKTSEMFKKHA